MRLQGCNAWREHVCTIISTSHVGALVSSNPFFTSHIDSWGTPLERTISTDLLTQCVIDVYDRGFHYNIKYVWNRYNNTQHVHVFKKNIP